MENMVHPRVNSIHSVEDNMYEVDLTDDFDILMEMQVDNSIGLNEVKKASLGKKDHDSKAVLPDAAPYMADLLDPFALHRHLTFLQILKSALLTVTLLPVRLVLMTLVLVIAYVLSVPVLMGLPKEQRLYLEPLSGWRRHWMKPFISRLARFIFFIGGWYWIPQRGRRATAKEAPILLVMPHSSFFDAILVMALDCPGMVVRDSTERTPLFGKLIQFQQPLLVRSGDPNSRRQIAEDIRRRVTSGKDWEQLLLFPEGGCGNRRALLQFKHGAFSPGVPIQPVFIRYKNKLDTVTWTWDGPGLLEQLWLTLTQFRVCCELEFLPVYNPSEEERLNPKLFADNVQKYVSGLTSTPVSLFSLEDAPYVKKARNLQLPPTAPLVKLLRLRKSIGRQDMDLAVELNFLKERKNSEAQVRGNVEDMAAYIGADRCPEALRDFFRIMDQYKKNTIDFRIYDAGLCLLRTDMKVKAKLQEAFECFEENCEVEHLEAVLLLWKGVPSSLSKLKSLNSFDKSEKELCIT